MYKQLQTQKKSKGFTLIELMVVIGIVAILTGAVYLSTSGSKADARFSIGEQELIKTYPETIQRMLIRNTNCTTIDKTDFITAGLTALNTFGLTWLVPSSTANTLTVTYPMLSNSDATTMVARVSSGFLINSATASGVNVTVVYSCL
jgi:prepilin-type N-terminal cleavage/methylation domain-containing protein